MSVVPEMISVVEMIFVEGKVRSSVLCEASETAAAAPTEVAATIEAAMCERGGRRQRQNTSQNQAGK